MLLCSELGLHNVLLEGNSQVVVKAIDSREEIWVDFGRLVMDTREILYRDSSWSIVFTYREANNVADTLAKLVLDFLEERVWI